VLAGVFGVVSFYFGEIGLVAAIERWSMCLKIAVAADDLQV
jgi:hypothetical protein